MKVELDAGDTLQVSFNGTDGLIVVTFDGDCLRVFAEDGDDEGRSGELWKASLVSGEGGPPYDAATATGMYDHDC